MRRFQALIVLFSVVVGFTTGLTATAQAQDEGVIHPIPNNGKLGDGVATIIYDPAGSWSFDTDGGKLVTTFELTSSLDFFVGGDPPWKVGLFDIYNVNKAFKLDPAGFSSLESWPAKPGYNATDLTDMLTVTGSFMGGGALDPIDVMVVPEPSSLMLLGLAGLAFRRRTRR